MSSASRPVSTLAKRYLARLEEYVADGGEAALLAAYELGRQALDTGAGLIDLTTIHARALDIALAQAETDDDRLRIASRGWEFFTESLGAFEMAQRGFREANLRLRSANELLERRSRELALANRELERTNTQVSSERATLSAVIASMSDGLIVVDADWRISLCNDRGGDLLGRDPASLLGHGADIIAEVLGETSDDPVRARQFWNRAHSSPDERTTFELRCGTPPRDVLVELFPIDRSTPAGVGVVLRDVTAERQLIRTKDALAAIVTHELRNPLAGIVAATELLLRGERSPDDQQRYLGAILGEGRRMGALIDDYLGLQRIDHADDRITPAKTDLQGLLSDVRDATPPTDPHVLVLDVPSGLPPVWADAVRIRQVLANLISNARKYSPEGGEIRVSARVTTGAVEITVADQGLGIPSSALPHLFDEFYRIETPQHRAITGTGLGLSISRKIIEAHGRHIWAESDGPGRGSRFVFTLTTGGPPGAPTDLR